MFHNRLVEESMPPRKRLFGLRERAAKASGSSERQQPNKPIPSPPPGMNFKVGRSRVRDRGR